MGLARDVILARILGADAGADAFFVAFKIPNFLRRLFAEGAFSQAFVPVLSELRAEANNEARLKHFVDHVAGCLGLSLVAVTSLCVIAAPLLALLFAPGFYVSNPEKFALTGDLIRVTFPYLLLISLAGFVGAILNSFDKFTIPAFTPVLLNICLILAAAWAATYNTEPAMTLAYGVLIAGLLQLGFQLPFVAKIGLLPRPRPNWRDPLVKKVLLLMAPAIFGVSVSQINLLLDTVLASFLPTGSVSWLYYSDRLTELPLGIFGVGIATVILPSLSRQFASGQTTGQFDDYRRTLRWGLNMVLLVAIPATIALVILAEPLLFALFHYGKTTAHDISMSTWSLQAYSVGLIPFMLIKILASAYFARQDTKTPVKIGIIAMVANMVLNLMFVVPLHFGWKIGHAGLALATSASALLNAWLLGKGLYDRGEFNWDKTLAIDCARLVAASACMGIVLALGLGFCPDFLTASASTKILAISLLSLGGFVVYGFCLVTFGWRLRHLKPPRSA